jgi:nucleoside-diphosphate-sugar epimerase
MKLVITGSEGIVGRLLMAAFPGAIGVDRVNGADVVVDFDTLDYASEPMRGVLAGADAIIHLAAEPSPYKADAAHWQSVINAVRFFAAAAEAGVPRFVVASSGWAVPMAGQYLSPYSHSKRVMEGLADMYDVAPGRVGRFVRIGWLPRQGHDITLNPEWEQALLWSHERLVAEFRKALED